MKKFQYYYKKHLIIVIIAIIVLGAASVYAATYYPSSSTTYDNSTSGMDATNVQSALDELYAVCSGESAVSDLLDKVKPVTSGNGLYKDEYEEGRYFYKGKNPNNYITFNGEKAGWRIISLNPDGTIKIMRNMLTLSTQVAWDSDGSTNWAKPSTMNTYLNSTYYNTLTQTAKSQIVSHDWGINSAKWQNKALDVQIYEENNVKWNGKVGLISYSEFLRANSNISNCKTSYDTWWDYYDDIYVCPKTNWVTKNQGNAGLPTITPSDTPYPDKVYFLYGSDAGASMLSPTVTPTSIKPVVYLNSKIRITGGTGTQSDPYTIA